MLPNGHTPKAIFSRGLLFAVLTVFSVFVLFFQANSPQAVYCGPAVNYQAESPESTVSETLVLKQAAEHFEDYHVSLRNKTKVKTIIKKMVRSIPEPADGLSALVCNKFPGSASFLPKPGYYLFLFRYTLF